LRNALPIVSDSLITNWNRLDSSNTYMVRSKDSSREKVDDKKVIQYLLGQLPEEERSRLEEMFFSDDELFEQLLAIEDDLIDDYVRNELSRKQRKQFELYFLSSPQRRERVEFARALLQTIPRPVSPRQSLLGSLRAQSPALRFSLATLIVLVIGGGSLLVIDALRLRSRIARIEAERIELQRQISQQSAHNTDLNAQLQRERYLRQMLEQEIARLQQLQPTIISFALLPGMTRDIDDPNRITIPPGAQQLRLRLLLERIGQYNGFRAELRGPEGEQIMSPNLSRIRPGDSGKAAVLSLPISLFNNGSYKLTLKGITSSGDLDAVGDYYFTIAKQ